MRPNDLGVIPNDSPTFNSGIYDDYTSSNTYKENLKRLLVISLMREQIMAQDSILSRL